MTEVRWEQYPFVAQNVLARNWLQRQAYLQLSPNTVDAYGRCLNDYLNFCAAQNIQPEAVTRDLVALYVRIWLTAPIQREPIFFPSKVAGDSHELDHAAAHHCLAFVLRLSLIEQQLRQDNPVGRGHYVPGRAFWRHA